MKTQRLFNILLASVTLLIGSVTFAQAGAPNGINYQAVIRKSDGTLVTNTQIAVRASIRQTTATGTVIFSERHNVTTDQWGLVNFVIGTGTFLSGSPFANINWGNGPYFLDLGVAFSGLPNPTIYMPYGTQQMMSVPFALYAKSSGNLLNQWSYGMGAPASNAGTVGDYYLDASSGSIYTKTNGTTWVLISNIMGPQGQNGVQGPQGPIGPQGNQGPAGQNATGSPNFISPTSLINVLGNQIIQGQLLTANISPILGFTPTSVVLNIEFNGNFYGSSNGTNIQGIVNAICGQNTYKIGNWLFTDGNYASNSVSDISQIILPVINDQISFQFVNWQNVQSFKIDIVGYY
jgi:hypothetical protein